MKFNTDLPLTEYLGENNALVINLDTRGKNDFDFSVLSLNFLVDIFQKMKNLGIPLPIYREKNAIYVGFNAGNEWYLVEEALLNPHIFYYITFDCDYEPFKGVDNIIRLYTDVKKPDIVNEERKTINEKI